MPCVRLKDNRNTTVTRYISQTPSGIVFSKAAATNFATPALARSYMNGAYPATIVNVSGWFQNQEYVLEDGVGYTMTDADALAFTSAAGITDNTQKRAVDDLVISLKAASIWTRMVAIYPFVGGTAASHKWNLKNPVDTDAGKRLTFSGGITHASTGVTPNGTTGIADTFIDFNLDIPQYSYSAGYYSRDNSAPGAADYFLWGQNNVWFDVYNVNRINVSFNQINYATLSTTSTTITGVTNFNRLLGLSMNGPSELKIYRDTTVLANDTTERRNYWSSTLPIADRTLRLFGSIGAPGWAGKTARECSFFFVGWGMDVTMWTSLSNAITTFQTALGRNV